MQEVLPVLFIGHVLGDFYFQSTELAKVKDSSWKKLLLHCLIYLATMLGISFTIFGWSLIKVALWVSVGHFLIDGAKFLLPSHFFFKKGKDTIIYLVDQALHILVLLAAGIYIAGESLQINYILSIETVINRLGVEMTSLLSWILILLVLMQPCSITIKKS
ncbi:DUF3307 domain-containing protein [Desemzia sp. RIT 804]|uniref:DUF3307 domain-containing protein n=1 Tax=Desemzia sp. RIT 804 TaxID=2810209 RepID=UPI001F36EE3D|nr:DUF3307 domain-containing protein [Desemzia sp. RIT 804]